MSTDIYAKPDLFKKVRYTRKEEGDREEWQENEVEIYESADDIGIHHFQSHDGGPHNEKQPPAVQRKLFIAAVFCLGVLCFLMLTAIILLSTYYISVTLEKDQLSNNYTQLQETVSDITANNSQLQSSYEILSKNHSQLEDEVKKLKDKIKEMRCPDGWTRFGCSCYFRSNQKRTWSQSRTDCQSKGADLVVINNKDENKCVSGLNMYEESWIGLKTERSTGTYRYEWKWVDGSPQTEMCDLSWCHFLC
ncbi:C-type lectin domain family 12 member B-like [Pagrus major]|uniref:C-type lectin domain family 12 member B-like n=1 Tax=Pagrus major TaxID=143350 RepID=UPI003CC84426